MSENRQPPPRIDAMARAAYRVWHENLNAPPWERASEMVHAKFYRLVQGMLDAAVADRKAA